jgi:pyruvate/2-oxoglutarate dehydrogenase complex dihydrolipoamide dehydrogenase (E3) component
MTKYDAILIGSGQAANPLARKLAEAGWKVALIERRWVGGTCINDGCTPTKTLISSGRIAHLIQRSGEYGISNKGYSVQMEEVIKRKNSVVLSFREGLTKSLVSSPNIQLIIGNAAFTGPKEVTVTAEDGSMETLTAEHIFINTGARPFIPLIPGLDQVDYLTSTSIMDLMEVPSHLVIVGAGYIALEFGQLFRRLGSEVTVLDSGEVFLPQEDEDIASALKEILEAEGIRIMRHSRLTEVLAAGSGDRRACTLTIATDQGDQTLHGSHLLVATGRRTDTAGLHTGAAGILTDEKGFIKVDDKLQTNIPGIYALGDVKGGPAFTHISYNDYLIVYKNLLQNGKESIAGRLPVYCLFTDPQLGRVGLTEKEARKKGIPIKIARLPVSHIARGIETGETKGLVKAIVHAHNNKIIGAAVLAPEGGELMSILQMAMMGEVTYDRIRDAVFAHPTFAESLNNLFAKLTDE